jgi:hypothetical protein
VEANEFDIHDDKLNSSNEKSIIQKPLQQTLFGKFCLFLIQLNSVVFVINFIVINIDYYWMCQFTGIDNMCFYGSYPLLGGYDMQSKFFFVNWIMSFVWFLILLIYKDQLAGWFMVPTTMEEATHMYVWTKNEVFIFIIRYLFLL